jgi:hypothetical protein
MHRQRFPVFGVWRILQPTPFPEQSASEARSQHWHSGSARLLLEPEANSGHKLSRMDALTLQLLTWIADRPRSYGETMEAWHTTCPRMPVWEDAVSAGLIQVGGNGPMRARSVGLTSRGRALLNGSGDVLSSFAAKQL